MDRQDQSILLNIIFSDEATFTRIWFDNTHNEDIGAEGNLNARKVSHYFKINVWATTLGNNLLGYHITPDNLNRVMYYECLSTKLYKF